MDQGLLGQATAELMDSIEGEEQFENAKLIAVGITVILERPSDETPDDPEEGETFCRTWSTERIHHRAVGLFRTGLMTIEDGHIPE
jgi:hypothetical protein